MIVGHLEATGIRLDGPVPAGVVAREREVPGEAQADGVEQLAADPQRAEPLRAEEPLLRRDRVHVDAQIAHVHRDGARGLRAIDEHQRAPLMGKRGNPSDRHHEAGRPQDVRERDELRARCDELVEALEDLVVGSIARELGEAEVDAESVADRVQRPDAAGVLVTRRDRAAAVPPVDRPRSEVHAVRGRVGDRDLVELAAEHRSDAGASLVHALDRVEVVLVLRPPEVALVRLELGHRRGDLRGNGARPSPCSAGSRRTARAAPPEPRRACPCLT